MIETNLPQMTKWRMRIACWKPKVTDTHSEYVILIALPLQQWLHERASVVRYAYTACLVLRLQDLFLTTSILCSIQCSQSLGLYSRIPIYPFTMCQGTKSGKHFKTFVPPPILP